MTSTSADAIRARVADLRESYGADNVHVLNETDFEATVLVTVDETASDMDRFGGLPGGVIPLRFFSIRPGRSFAMPMNLKNMKMDLTANGDISFSGRFVHPPAVDPVDVFADALRSAGTDDDG